MAVANLGAGAQLGMLEIPAGDLVALDAHVVHRDAETTDGLYRDYPFPIAGLVSWLVLKSLALRNRRKDKDPYDIVWTLQTLGPDQATRTIAESPILADAVARREALEQLTILRADFADPNRPGAVRYSRFLQSDDSPILRRDASEAVVRALDPLLPETA